MELSPQHIAIAQINVTVGDLAANVQRMADAYRQSVGAGAQLVVFPELAVCGYPPEDLVLRPSFRLACAEAISQLAALTKDRTAAMIVGGVYEDKGHVYNAAFVLSRGEVVHVQPKVKLPNYGVFDEKRLFSAGTLPAPCDIGGVRIGILVCEDMWSDDVPKHLQQQGVQLLVSINASPYEDSKHERRLRVAARTVQQAGVPLVYANLVGGQDDLVFDGASFLMDAGGRVVTQLASFEECVACPRREASVAVSSREASVYGALVLGLRDYVGKNGFSGVVLGLSGGIDSALVAAIAVDALGAQNVKGVLLPSPYNAQSSSDDALESARLLGIETVTVPITPAMQTFEAMLEPAFTQLGKNKSADAPFVPVDWLEDPQVGGNVQARIRGNVLMAISNRLGLMLLSTGNKSELSVGYTTMYGDMCGGYAPLKDVYKTTVYALSHWRNGRGRVIPENSITKPPSAELKPNQRDDDQLPPYDVLDAMLERLIEKRESVAQLIAAGYDRALVEKVEWLLRSSEYKRRQSPPGVKVTTMLHGKDRRFPLTNKFKG